MTSVTSSSLLVTLLLSATPNTPAPPTPVLTVAAVKSHAAPSVSPLGKRLERLALRDVLGTARSLDDWKDKKALVVVFLCTECPLARQYGPKLGEMAEKYADKRVQFVAIDSNQTDTLAEIEHFQRVHKIGFPILRDPANKIADELGARRTPEVFLLDQSRVVRYWGRIDDQFGIGYARNKPNNRYLQEALDAILEGRSIQTAAVESVGCRINRVNRQPKGEVTYANQIAPLLQSRCVACHQTGEIAPFPLTSYADASGWADTIREVVESRRMPPWFANPKYGKFSNDCRLSDDERRLLCTWIDNGAPEGTLAVRQAELRNPEFASGWRIPKPDLVVRMPKPFKVRATGIVQYQYFTIDPGFKHDVWVRASEGHAGNAAVVHHMVLFFVPPEQKEPRPEDPLFRTIGSFAPGTPAMIPPEGVSRRIPAGSRLVFQMHYTPNGSEQFDQSEVGLVFDDPKEVRKELKMGAVVNFAFLIPPGESNFRLDADDDFDEDTLIYAMLPHMHFRGKSFRYTAVYPGGKREILLDVPRYDFNWQNVYWLAEPKLMPAGTRLVCEASFDNSADNLANPDPSRPVHWGDQTWDEMMVGSYYYCPANQDFSLGPPRVTPKGKDRYEALFRFRPTKTAKSVYLAGSFNGWKKDGSPMSGPDKDGFYTASLDLPAGRHEYKFFVDGKKWRVDPGNPIQTGKHNSSLLVIGKEPRTK
jgi:thiol-disulfide isomerase/thioredoxin